MNSDNDKELKEFINKLAVERGAIVSSADCSSVEIAHARADGRLYVDAETSYGYVLRLKEWREGAEELIRRQLRSQTPGYMVDQWASGKPEEP